MGTVSISMLCFGEGGKEKVSTAKAKINEYIGREIPWKDSYGGELAQAVVVTEYSIGKSFLMPLAQTLPGIKIRGSMSIDREDGGCFWDTYEFTITSDENGSVTFEEDSHTGWS